MATLSKVTVVAGYGTGISAAVGKRFGSEGFHLALLARTASRLDAAVAGAGAAACRGPLQHKNTHANSLVLHTHAQS